MQKSRQGIYVMLDSQESLIEVIDIEVRWQNRIYLKMRFNKGKLVHMYSYTPRKKKKKSIHLKKLLRLHRRSLDRFK